MAVSNEQIQAAFHYAADLTVRRVIQQWSLVGSAAYMPEHAEDLDIAMLLHNGHSCNDDVAHWLADGWQLCGEYDTRAGTWLSVRKDHVNLMITHDPQFFEGYKRATELCAAMRIADKAQRIAVCQIVRDGLTRGVWPGAPLA